MGWSWVVILIAMLFLTLSCAQPAFPLPPPSAGAPAAEDTASEPTRRPGDELTISKGLVIITGCAHPGVVNIIRKAKDIVSEERVYLVMGGFHLAGESTSRIESIIEQFR